MTFMKLRAGVLAAAALTLAVAACTDDTVDIKPNPYKPASPIFKSYVALGNGITAGYQSGGISDATQQRSYAAILAGQMHTQYAYPALAGVGCPPPIEHFLTQARVGSGTSTTCFLRNAASASAALNNVAVPGAAVIDLLSTTTRNSNILTQLFLGGKPQAIKALDAAPTFASVWMGNNDVLDAAVKGIALFPADSNGSTGLAPYNKATLKSLTAGITPVTAFDTLYRNGVNRLRQQNTALKGVLIGVVNVTAIPILFPAAALLDPTFKGGFDQYAGGTVTVDPGCATSSTLISFAIVQAMRAGSLPRTVSCTKTPGNPVGDYFMLDAAEQGIFNNTITQYNTYIHAKADSIGFAYLDPNPLLGALKSTGAIPTVPNIGSDSLPYGRYISLDGIHPSSLAHQVVANALIKTINAKYGTALDTVAHP